MSEPAEPANESARTAEEPTADGIGQLFDLGPGPAQLLVTAGYTSFEDVRALADSSLEAIGLTPDDIRRVRTAIEARSAEPPMAEPATERPTPESTVAADGNRIVERWMDSVRKAERPKRRHVPVAAKDSAEVLRKWVQGDDRAMEAWIQSSETPRPAPVAPAPRAPVPVLMMPEPSEVEGPLPSTPLPGPEPPISAGGLIPAQLREREETVVRWLTELLDRVKSDQFDPGSLLQEVQELNRQLYEERAKRKQLDEELEHVKRGSIAVIKYVRSREAKTREQALQEKDAEIAELRLKLFASGEGDPELSAAIDGPPNAEGETGSLPEGTSGDVRELSRRMRAEFEGREQVFIERETELRRRIVQLEGDIRRLRAEEEAIQEREQMVNRSAGDLSESLSEKLKESESREKDLLRRENELRTKFEEIRINAEELERKREPMAYKEKELSRWESQIQSAKQAVEAESRRLEQIRAESEATGISPASQEEIRRMEGLKNELLHKEEEQKAREAFLNQRMEEIEVAQRKLAAGESEQMVGSGVADVAEKKVKSGVRRLDDLLFGGFPVGAQVLVNGPAHTGKDVLARMFVAEGLRMGIPIIWVVTDKTYSQIREEMTVLFPGYPEAEQRGLVRYVDLYARSLGITQAEPGVRLLSSTDKGVLEQITQAVNAYSAELKDRATTYRLVFESVSTVTAYLDTTATFRFLQPFAGRRKMDGASSYYLLETGMHTESDLQTLEHMMDGSVNLKVDQLKTFLSVRGIAEAQSRAWIGFTFSKKAFSLGSFSLDHIR